MSSMTEFKNKYGPWALIAGGSEGIGRSFSEQIAAHGINLILLGRRMNELENCADAIRREHGVTVECHAVDLTDPALQQTIESITDRHDIGLLIYNAGAMHGAELLHDQALDSALRMVDLNCRGPLVLCHLLGARMRARRRGGIVLMSSLAALWGGAYMATYAATKSFDIVFAQSLWQELKPYGVDVLSLIAGATDTPAMARSGVEFAKFGTPMASADVAREGLQQLGNGPTWVCGEANRARLAAMRDMSTAQCVEMMTQGAMLLYEKPAPGSV